MQLETAIGAFRQFCGGDLTATLARIESALQGASASHVDAALSSFGVSEDTLASAGQLKQLVGQLNVVIHAVGILLCLPRILEAGEAIESVSLGAGNTGRLFDLETDRRVAEFKFIAWQGGAETIRQNGIFKDFYLLAEYETGKKKYLYVLGTHHPLKFLNGGRALDSVLSKNVPLHRQFKAKYEGRYRVVREYYHFRKSDILVEDVSPLLSGLMVANDESAAAM